MADKKKTSLTKSTKAPSALDKAKVIVAKSEADKKKSVKNSKNAKKKPNKVVKYLKDLKSEIKKVVWPSFSKVRNNTLVVVVTMTLCGLAIWGIDSGLTAIIRLALSIKD